MAGCTNHNVQYAPLKKFDPHLPTEPSEEDSGPTRVNVYLFIPPLNKFGRSD
jgi:hypothetical protein